MTISGTADVGFQAINYKGNTVNGFNQNGSATSGFKIQGSEDLGGGLKANFVFGSDFNLVSRNANTGSTGASGATPVTVGTFGNTELGAGLQGNFGKVDIGHLAFNTLTTFTTGQPFGTAIGGGYASVTRVNASASLVRDDNALRYVSPSFSGLTVSLFKSNKQTKATSTDFNAALGAYDKLGSEEIGLNYVNGPLAASFSSLKQDSKDVGTTTTSSTVNTLGANYAIGAAKVYGLYQTNKNTGAATTAATVDTQFASVSASYTMGATTLMAQVGELKAKAGTYNGEKSSLVGLGADYALSKRTALYARYEAINDKAVVIAAASTIDGTGTKRTRTALGVRHAF